MAANLSVTTIDERGYGYVRGYGYGYYDYGDDPRPRRELALMGPTRPPASSSSAPLYGRASGVEHAALCQSLATLATRHSPLAPRLLPSIDIARSHFPVRPAPTDTRAPRLRRPLASVLSPGLPLCKCATIKSKSIELRVALIGSEFAQLDRERFYLVVVYALFSFNRSNLPIVLRGRCGFCTKKLNNLFIKKILKLGTDYYLKCKVTWTLGIWALNFLL